MAESAGTAETPVTAESLETAGYPQICAAASA